MGKIVVIVIGGGGAPGRMGDTSGSGERGSGCDTRAVGMRASAARAPTQAQVDMERLKYEDDIARRHQMAEQMTADTIQRRQESEDQMRAQWEADARRREEEDRRWREDQVAARGVYARGGGGADTCGGRRPRCPGPPRPALARSVAGTPQPPQSPDPLIRK